jgi:hypothetical protein
VRLTQRAVEALRSHRKRQLEEKLRVGGLYQDQGLVFTGEGGGLINPSNLRQRSFMPARFVRVLDSLGYTCFRRWRIYGEEALAGREAALWLATESLTVEHAGESLSRYEVRIEPESGELRSVARSRLFENYHGLRRPQRRLFALDSLGEGGWLKALKLRGYVARGPRRPPALQQALFAYAETP